MTLQEAYATLKVEKKKRTLVVKELRGLNMEKISAGIHAADGKQEVSKGFKLIDLAVQNEFGNSWVLTKAVSFFKNGKWWHLPKGKKITIPATRFVSRIIQDPMERKNLVEDFKAALYILLKYGEGGQYYTVKDLVRSVGTCMCNSIKRGIDSKYFLPNAAMTQAIKGFDKRLYETGFLYNSIKFRSKKARVSSD